MIFEKIRERLQEARNQLEKSCVKVRSKEDCEKHTECGACIMDCAIEIVNEVETEYKEEYKSKCADCTRRKFYMMGYQAAKQNNGWIPCSERLPIGEEYRKIIDGLYFYKHMLTTTNEDDIPICVGWYDQENEVWCDLEGFAFYPIAWQSLPEPYIPKGE